MWNLKIQHTSEYNKKEADLQMYRTTEVTSRERGEGRYRDGGVGGTNYWVQDRLKDGWYNTENRGEKNTQKYRKI